jgi:Protein of unknown function (DUF1573)
MKLAIILAALAVVSAHAELKFENTTRKFTYTPGKKAFKTEFAFTNTGTTKVKLTDVRGGCVCCTAARPSKWVIAPGERATITMRVDVSGKQLPTLKPVAVLADDGSATTLIVEVATADGKPVKVPRWGK